MSLKKKELAETAASDTLDAANAAGKSKSEMISQTLSAMAQMPYEDLSHFFNDSMAIATSKYYAQGLDHAAENENSITTHKAMKEDLDNMFGSQELSEEFQNKAAVLFESAVNIRVQEELAKIEEEYEGKLDEEVEEIRHTLIEQIDGYMTSVAEQWLQENEVAIENGLKVEMAESLMEDLKALFESHNIEVPTGKMDIVEELADRVDALEEELNESLNTNLELTQLLEDFHKNEIVESIGEGLTVADLEKLQTLSESIEYTGDDDAYINAIKILREHNFDKGTKSTAKKAATLTESMEEPFEGSETERPVSREMQHILKALQKTTPK